MENIYILNLIKRIIRKLYYLPKGFIGNWIFKSNKVLNYGERYDPFLSSFTHHDMCHLPRYEFAMKHISKSDEVLDIACGTGYGSSMLSTVSDKVTGVDRSDEAIAYATEKSNRPNVSYIVSDFFESTVSADTVVSFETIEHIKTSSIDDVLEKLLSFSKSKIIGSIPYKESPGNNPHHYFFNLYEDSLNLFKAHGDVQFFYQAPTGSISDRIEGTCQNLIFIFTRHQQSEDDSRE